MGIIVFVPNISPSGSLVTISESGDSVVLVLTAISAIKRLHICSILTKASTAINLQPVFRPKK